MYGQIEVKCCKCGFTTNIPYFIKPDEFVRGCDILEGQYKRAERKLDIRLASDGKWWLYDEHGGGQFSGKTIAELIGNIGKRDPI